jgi:hypothetical protein
MLLRALAVLCCLTVSVLMPPQASAGQEPAFIRATPNPVQTDAIGFNGTTKIEWNTGDGQPGLVYLSVNAGPEELFATGPSGEQYASFIRLDSSNDFILYDGSHKIRLAVVQVLPRPIERTVVKLTFVAVLLIVALGSFTWRDPAAFRRRVSPVLALVMTAVALLPILTKVARPLHLQPFPDAAEYADGARQLASGNGYVHHVHVNDTWPDDGKARPSKYPPGFSLILVPFAALGNYPDDVLNAAKGFAALYLIVAVAAAWAIGGPLAAMLAAGLIGISPFAEQSAMVLLADAFGAALTVVLVPLLNKPTTRRTVLAGAIAGFSVLVRFNMIVNIAAIALGTRGRTRRLSLLCAAPSLAVLLLYQWLTFGSPLTTGYSYWWPDQQRLGLSFAFGSSERAGGSTFSDAMYGKLMRWACPCPPGGSQVAFSHFVFYPAVLLGVFWVFAPPLVSIIGLLHLWRHRRAPPVAVAMWIIVFTVGLYAVHFYQSERFMAAPATLLTVFAAVALAGWVDRKRLPNAAH